MTTRRAPQAKRTLTPATTKVATTAKKATKKAASTTKVATKKAASTKKAATKKAATKKAASTAKMAAKRATPATKGAPARSTAKAAAPDSAVVLPGMPAVGRRAPAFKMLDEAGRTVDLSSLKGKSVVLYFYPKDNTPGCTIEACDFRDHHAAFAKAGAVILGVSPDSSKSHAGFRGKYELPFSLLVDAEHGVAETYGVWVEKSMYGRRYMGIQRATFLIDKDGAVAKVWPKVKVDGHAADVLATIKSL